MWCWWKSVRVPYRIAIVLSILYMIPAAHATTFLGSDPFEWALWYTGIGLAYGFTWLIAAAAASEIY